MSTRKWPTVAGRISKTVTIWHAQAWAGNPDLHSHEFRISFCWKHEINPGHGHTWSIHETQAKVDKLCGLVDGKNLNEILPNQPTAETLACWLIVRAPSFYSAVEIDCYENYQVRIERTDLPKSWESHYLGDETPQGLTA